MLPLLMALPLTLLAHDRFEVFPLWRGGPAWAVWVAGLAPAAAIVLAAWRTLDRCGLQLDRTGDDGSIALADRIIYLSRWAVTAGHALACLVLGWPGAVRAAAGDWVLLDEVLIIAPPMLGFVGLWAAQYGVERRVWEAELIRRLDDGGVPARMPRRWAYALEQFRHHAAPVLLPVAALGGWAELLDRAALAALQRGWVSESIIPAWMEGLSLAGFIVLVLLAPLGLRWVWLTEPLGAGVLRDRLELLCRAQRVRFREILVWRTPGPNINGAVVGLIAPVRYILLTETLLERLPLAQVEAVMAHEAAHARRRHLPWLIGSVLAGMGLSWLGVSAGASGLAWADHTFASAAWAEAWAGIAFAVSLAAAGGAFILVSRAFEEQADAFAVQHLSGWRAGASGAGVTLTAEAAAAMSGALMSVARWHHIPPAKPSWRHGSIALRCMRIAALVGRRADELPIDRRVRRLKACIGAALLLSALAWAAVGWGWPG